MNLDDLTGNETPEELEALLDTLEADELEGEEASQVKPEPEKTEVSEVDNTEASAPLDDEAEEPEKQEATDKGILAKDGENIIPFDVLERERAEKRELQDQLDALKQRETEWEDSQRLLDLRNKQLEKVGVAPADLPENIKVTDEQLDALADDYPEIGNVIRHLVAKVNQIPEQGESSHTDDEPNQDPVQSVIDEISDLSAWQKEGGDNWQKALHLDEQLQVDPKWQSKPLNERFSEVVKQVNAMNAESQSTSKGSVSQKAKKEEEQLDSLPNSPSEMGQTNTTSQSVTERIETANEDEIQSMFYGMTGDQIEALLSELDT